MRQMRIALFLAIAVALIGCTGFSDKFFVKVEKLEHGQAVEARPGEAVVFGRIVIKEDGVTTGPYPRYDEPIFGLIHLDTDKRARGGRVEHDGRFYWRLPRGTYIVDAIHTTYSVLPQAVFRVPEGADAYYLGTLVVDLKFAEKIIGRRYIYQKGFIVNDEYEKAKKALHYHSPGFSGKIEKNLMLIDERLPQDPKNIMRRTGEVRELLDIPPSPK